MNDAVLIFSGLDPCGGAGVSADIETINQFGLTALPIITVLTVQNTQSVINIEPVDAALITQQCQHLQADITVRVAKIGLLSSVEQVNAIAKLCQDQSLKIVLDPIVKSSTEATLLQTQAIEALIQNLLPLVTVLTPNSSELSALSEGETEQKKIENLPCEWVLVTTTDVSDVEIEHRLYRRGRLVKSYSYQKLLGDYHGSGCTLSSAIAASIAQGLSVENACQKALDYTYQTLLNAKNIGKMQKHPNRQKYL